VFERLQSIQVGKDRERPLGRQHVTRAGDGCTQAIVNRAE
jgi:hypothetical protein